MKNLFLIACLLMVAACAPKPVFNTSNMLLFGESLVTVTDSITPEEAEELKNSIAILLGEKEQNLENLHFLNGKNANEINFLAKNKEF